MSKRISLIKKQILSTIVILSMSNVAYAETYTSTATKDVAWSGTWSPTASPVTQSINGTLATYSFLGDNTYVGNTNSISLINDNATTDVKVVSAGAAISFDNWNVGGGKAVVSGKSVELGDNITFDNTTGIAIKATDGTVKLGNNVTISNSTNNHYGHYGAGISINGKSGTSIIGENFTASNNTFSNTINDWSPFRGGAAIGMRYTMDLTIGNNAVFENNIVQTLADSAVSMGGAISGAGNQERLATDNNLTFNGSVALRNNSAIATGAGSFAQGGAIGFTKASGTPRKTADATFNGGSGTIEISGNMAQSSNSSRGGALYVGDGNIYISGDNIIIKNNIAENTVGGNVFGGAIYVSSTDRASGGNLTIAGNATITGNVAKSNGNAVGGAIFADGDITLKPNATGNRILFRDNQAATDGAAINLNKANKTLLFDYANGGTIDIYDNINIVNGSSLIQRGDGTTTIRAQTHGGTNAQIESGRLILAGQITLPDTVTGAEATYDAGWLTGQNVTIGTVGNPGAIIDIHEGAEVEGGYNSTGGLVTINDNNTINIYGSGSINLTTDASFNRFGADSSEVNINIGDNNNINLAARTEEQIAAGIQNKRGTDGTKFTAMHIDNLGSGNTFTINTNLAGQTADKLVIGTGTSGTNYIKINYDPNFGTVPDGTKTLIVEAETPGTSSVGEFEGVKSDLGAIAWTPELKRGDGSDTNWYIIGGTKEESTTVDSAKSMARLLNGTLRFLNTNLLRRMGELRFNEKSQGVWAKVSGGENYLVDGVGRQKFSAIQGGIDYVREFNGGKVFHGVAIENVVGNSTLGSGTGRTTISDLALYSSWFGNKGHYYDLVLKGYKISNKLDLLNTENINVNGDYKTSALGISMEYGRRQDYKDGYFFTPQAQLSYLRVGGVDYQTTDNVRHSQSKMNSLVGSIGFVAGRKFANNSQMYVQIHLNREFIGGFNMVSSDTMGNIVNNRLHTQETWLNIGLGATGRLSDSTDAYFEVEKDFGGKNQLAWKAQLGLRYSW